MEDFTEDDGVLLKKARAKSKSGTLTDSVQAGQALPNAIDMYRRRAADLYAQGSDVYNSEPDMAPLQTYAKQRGEQGSAAMLNALAAQFAGESFQPVQAQFLKKAAAAQDAMKVGSGLITAEGQYIKDPEAAQTKKAEFLLQQAKAYETLAQNAETARERLEAQRAQQETMNQFKQMQLGIMAQNAQTARMNAGTGNDSRTWRAEDTLRGDFEKNTKDLQTELGATSKIMEIVRATPPGQKPDAITQQSLVILLNKFLDPGSVVREGEFDRVVKAQGLEGQAKNLADRILKGQPLDANTINQINGLASFYNNAATQKIQREAENISTIATRRGLNTESIISDPKFRAKPQAPGASGGLSAQEQAELEALRKQFGR